MPAPTPLPDDAGWILDTGSFDLEHYCGAFILGDAEDACIIETGPSGTVDTITAGLKDLGIPREAVSSVIVTHIHMDHAGGAWKLLRDLPNATLHVHEKGAPFLTDPELNGKLLRSVQRAVGPERFPFFGTLEPIPEERVQAMPAKGATIEAAGRELHLHDAPGHAPHHLVVEDPTTSTVWMGDVMGIRMPNAPLLMTTPPPRFDLDAWTTTLDRLEALDPTWAALTHYGWQPFETHLEQFRPRLAAWVDEIELLRERFDAPDQAAEAMLDAHPEILEVYGQAQAEPEMRMDVAGVWLWFDRRS